MKNCRTCKYARFVMTKHNPPRINGNYAGRCRVQIQIPMFADAFLNTYDQPGALVNTLNPEGGHTIVVDAISDNCQLWELKCQ